MAFRDITVFIKANVSGLQTGLQSASKQVKNFGTQVSTTSKSTNQMVKNSQNLTAATNMMARQQGVAAARVNHYSRALGSGSAVMASMAQQTGLASKAMAGFQTLAAQTAGALVGFLAVNAAIQGIMRSVSTAINAWRSFDQAMTESLAIMSGVSDEIRDNLSNAAREMATQSTFSATQVAEAYFYLASAGLDAKASLLVLDETVRFAQAGAFDLAQATDFLTDAQSAMGLVSRNSAGQVELFYESAEEGITSFEEQYVRVSDVLVKANQISNASVEQFSKALTTKSAAASRQLGISLEETTAVLSVFADQGIKAQKAGTAYSMVLRDLTTKAIKNGDAFKEMGIQVFDNEGEFRDFADIIGEMEEAFAGMSDEQIRSSLLTLGFTDRSVAATSALLGTSNQLRAYKKELEAAGGATDEVANKQLESFNAKVELLGSKVLDLAIGAGEKFNEWLNDIRESDDWKNIVDGVKAFGSAMKDAIETGFELAKMLGGPAFLAFGKAMAVAGFALEKFSILSSALAAGALLKLGSALLATKTGTLLLAHAQKAAGLSMVSLATNVQALQAKYKMLRADMGVAQATMATMGATAKATGAAVASSFNTMAVGAAKFAAAVAPAVLLGAIMNIGKTTERAKDSYEEMVSEIQPESFREAGVFKSFKELTDYTNQVTEKANEATDAFNEFRGGEGGAFEIVGAIATQDMEKLGKTVQYTAGEVAGFTTQGHELEAAMEVFGDAAEVAHEKHARYRTQLEALLPVTNSTQEAIEATAYSLGIDLGGSAEEVAMEMPRLLDAIRMNELAIDRMGMSMEDLDGEEILEVVEDADKASEEFASAMQEMVSETEAFEAALSELPTATDAFDKVMDDKEAARKREEEQAKKAARDNIDALRDQRDREMDLRADGLDNLEDSLDARQEALEGATEEEQKAFRKQAEAQREAYQDQTDALDDSWEARIDGAQDGADRLADTIDDGVQDLPTWGEILSELGQLQDGSTTFAQQLDDIVMQGLDEFAGDTDKERAVLDAVEFLKELGPEEGGPLATEILNDVGGFVEKYNGELGRLGEASTFSFEQYLGSLRAQTIEFLDVQKNLFTLASNLDKVEGGTVSMLEKLATESPEALAFLANEVSSGNISAFQQFIDEQGSLIAAKTVASHQELLLDLTEALTTADTGKAEQLIDNNEEKIRELIAAMDPEMAESFRELAGEHLDEFEEDGKKKIQNIINELDRMKNTWPGEGKGWVNPFAAADAASGYDGPPIVGALANGGIIRAFANGGMEKHQAKIHSSTRLFAEPETRGEAYIPLARHKRTGSMGILDATANLFGMDLVPKGSSGPMGVQMGGAPSSPSVVKVEVPQTAETNYNFGDITASDPAATVEYARRQARRRNLTGVGRS